MNHESNARTGHSRVKQYQQNLQTQLLQKDFKMSEVVKTLDATARKNADLQKALTDAQQAHASEKKDLQKALTDAQEVHANEKERPSKGSY